MVLFFALPCTALAEGNAAQEAVATAHAHALMAAGADSLEMTQAHLQHVINCLVGPDGEGFDAEAANPCESMGAGALPDSAGSEAERGQLKEALAAAQSGVKADSQESAQKAANSAAELLKSSDGGQ
jgi:hypothetical protein